MKSGKEKKIRASQEQELPGEEGKMKPLPVYDDPKIKGSGKLKGKVAIITGGDSGIGRAVAVLFAKEGADVVVAYLKEDKDAKQTQEEVEKYKSKCLLISGDVSEEKFCNKIARTAIKEFGKID